ncbi:uncharacterized protein [Penaeus vannamei]|uniref:uncharacterized protein n=1 Tax=Penaeus vannamei TaxID=6689 RepID=UPI00387F7BB5
MFKSEEDRVHGNDLEKSAPTSNIVLNGKTLKQVEKFKYLITTLITTDARRTSEISCRISQAKAAFQTIGNILASRKISMNVRKRVLNTYVYPILMYSSEIWNINKHQKRLEATEMWFLRWMLRISYKDHVKNEDVLKRAETSSSQLNHIRIRQATFFGRIMRQLGMEHTVTTGKICGKRDRGRQREKMLDGLTAWLQTSDPSSTIASVWNGEEWRTMIAEAAKHGT